MPRVYQHPRLASKPYRLCKPCSGCCFRDINVSHDSSTVSDQLRCSSGHSTVSSATSESATGGSDDRLFLDGRSVWSGRIDCRHLEAAVSALWDARYDRRGVRPDRARRNSV